jgi:hypothetical protein
MTKDEFKALQVGDRVTHPAFIGFLTITHIETSFDYTTSPPKQCADAITVDTGHRLKIIDERDVRLLKKIN